MFARALDIRMSDSDNRDSDRREKRKRELISQEAAEWFARMKDHHASLEDRRRFVSWLKQSHVHVAEYLKVAGIHGNLRRAHLRMIFGEELPSNVVELFADESERSAARTTFSPARWKIAATIAACGLGALLFLVARTTWYERSIETQPGQWKEVKLADGSELQIGPNTRLTLDLDDSQRLIRLVSGEAYFKVASDAQRPFVVESHAFSIRDIGTEFAVARRKDELIVTVKKGAVRVAPSVKSAQSHSGDDLPAELSVPINADFQLRIAGTWPVTPSRVDVRYALAWRERMLMFQAGDTLADAVEEFNLRNRIQLRLDPRVAALPVRGTFDASDPVAFAQTIDRNSPVALQPLAPDTLLITAE